MNEKNVTTPLRPTNAEELAAMVRAAGAEGMQVRVSGSNSLPLVEFDANRRVREVSLLRMNQVIEHAVGDMTVVVQAGISLEALQRALAWRNQWLPVDPPMVARAGSPLAGGGGGRTIGGLIATNALGPLRLGCGDWRLLIMGMKWVDGSGRIIKGGGRTVKNVAGYSTPRMMIGSCGSLGAIAEVTLRTFARPAEEGCVIFFCDAALRAEELIAAVMASEVRPAYVQAIGGGTFSMNPLQLPTMKRGVAVVVGFLDRSASCAAQMDRVRALAGGVGGEIDAISQTAAQAGRLRLWMTTEPRVEPGQGIGFRMGVLPSETCAVVAGIEAAARKAGARGGEAWVVSEAGTGVVRGCVRAGEGISLELLREVMARCAKGGEILTTQGADGGADHGALMVRIKNALDPMNVFGWPRAAMAL